MECRPHTLHNILPRRRSTHQSLRKLNPKDGYLAERFHSDMTGTDGADKGKAPENANASRPMSAPYTEYKGDKHDAFWYFDKEMADIDASIIYAYLSASICLFLILNHFLAKLFQIDFAVRLHVVEARTVYTNHSRLSHKSVGVNFVD